LANLARLYQRACAKIKALDVRVTRLEQAQPHTVERVAYRQSGCADNSDPMAGWK